MFLRVLCAFIFLLVLRALIFLRVFRAFIILRAYILYMYTLIKLTQINENLSIFIKYFHYYKTRAIFCMSVIF